MSGSQPDAENLRPSPTAHGTTSDGAQPTCTALEWNIGMHT